MSTTSDSLGAFAEFDRETIIDNTTRGRARGAKNGRWYGVVPFGYTVRDRHLTVNEVKVSDASGAPILGGISEADLVREVFERVAAGTTATKEAARLESLRVPCQMRYASHQGRGKIRRANGQWDALRVTRMIHNTIYRGEHTYKGRDGDLVRPVPPLVTADVWENANRQLTSNRKRSKRNTKYEYLLAGLIRCGVCGHGYGCARVNSRGHRYYQCLHLRVNGDQAPGEPAQRRCRGKAIPVDWIEAANWADCERFARNPGPIIDDVRRQYQERQKDADTIAEQRRTFTNELAAKDRERETIITMARRNAIRIDEAEAQPEAIGKERRAIQAELDAIANKLALADIFEAQAQSAKALLHKIAAQLDTGLSFEARRAVVRNLVGQITVYTDGERNRKSARIAVNYRFAAPKQLHPQAAAGLGTSVGDLLRR